VGDYAWERARLRQRTRLDLAEFQRAGLPWDLAGQRRLRSLYVRLADRVVAPSRFLRDLIVGWGAPPDRIRVVYNGLTPLPEPLPPADRSLWGAAPGERLILTAARLVDWKGLDDVIAALGLLNRPARLLVLGEGPERAGLEALTRRLGLAGRVVFGGRVSRGRVLAALAAADVFVLASGYEGLPHVVLEAMAAGAPVVAARAGGTPEVVESGRDGLLVAYGRVEELARALDRILAEPKLAASFRRAGRARAADFPWARTVAQTRELIEEMLA